MTGEPTERELRDAAREAFGPGFPALERFADALTEDGVLRGLIGPREVPRLWERHLLNSAVLGRFLPEAGTVVDVGSGAGLPGVVLACLRPDLEVVLLEPMERRTTWLTEVAELLALPHLRVVRARAEEMHGRMSVDAVTARAVAPLDRLARWTLPLLRGGGTLLALKGAQAEAEVATAGPVLRRLGGVGAEVLRVAPLPGMTPTGVVRVRKAPDSGRPRQAG